MLLTLNKVDPKDPAESKLYTMDWSGGLNSGSTISTSTWTMQPSGLTNAGDGIVAGNLKTSIEIAGGKPNTEYWLTNTITTSDGETLQRTGMVLVQRI